MTTLFESFFSMIVHDIISLLILTYLLFIWTGKPILDNTLVSASPITVSACTLVLASLISISAHPIISTSPFISAHTLISASHFSVLAHPSVSAGSLVILSHSIIPPHPLILSGLSLFTFSIIEGSRRVPKRKEEFPLTPTDIPAQAPPDDFQRLSNTQRDLPQ